MRICTKNIPTCTDNDGYDELKYSSYPVGNYMFKVNNTNPRTRCETCSKLAIKTLERRDWRRSGVFIVNFEPISHLALVLQLLTLNI